MDLGFTCRLYTCFVGNNTWKMRASDKIVIRGDMWHLPITDRGICISFVYNTLSNNLICVERKRGKWTTFFGKTEKPWANSQPSGKIYFCLFVCGKDLQSFVKWDGDISREKNNSKKKWEIEICGIRRMTRWWLWVTRKRNNSSWFFPGE